MMVAGDALYPFRSLLCSAHACRAIKSLENNHTFSIANNLFASHVMRCRK